MVKAVRAANRLFSRIEREAKDIGVPVTIAKITDANQIGGTLNGEVAGLQVDRIDPKVETQRYIDKIMAAKSPGLDAQEQALLLEDLQSPCTEEVAVFHAFSHIVNEARSAFVVLDTAPTGHSMLLMDATGAYVETTAYFGDVKTPSSIS